MPRCPHLVRRSLLGALAVMPLLSPTASAQVGLDPAATAVRIDELLDSYAEQRRFSGVALVATDGEVVYKGAFGFANLEWEIPNTPETRFRIGSLTKMFTAVLVLQLAEEGALSLEAPISEYLPEYPRPQGDRITIHHLLTHTSGLPSYTDLPEFTEAHSRDPMTPSEIIALTWSEPLSFEPGTRFEYCNSGYVLLGWLVERVTGSTYEAALGERILVPLELANTGYVHGPRVLEREASGYHRTLSGVENAPYMDTAIPFAAGGMYSTADDLYRWGRALRSGEPFRKTATLDRMLAPVMEGYGYGLFIRERDLAGEGSADRVLEGSGAVPGFQAVVRFIPEEDKAVVLLANAGSELGPLLDGITGLLYGRAAPPPKVAVSEPMVEAIEARGVQAGLELYFEAREEPDRYDVSPRQIFLVARHYLDLGATATALALLEAQVEAYPQLPIPRYALAETYAAVGDTTRAIAVLEEAVERFPGMPHLIQALAEMRGSAPP